MPTAQNKRRRNSDLPNVLDPEAAAETFTQDEVPTNPARPSGVQRSVLRRPVTEVDARRGRRTDPREE